MCIRDRGKFILKSIASAAALNVWIGIGMNAQNTPIAAPPADERLCICHIFGSCKYSSNSRMILLDAILSLCGIYRLNRLRKAIYLKISMI